MTTTKTLLRVIFIIFLLSACSKDPFYKLDHDESCLTLSKSSESFCIYDPIKFIDQNNIEEWTETLGIEKRFEKAEVSLSVLESMSTDALAKSILNYPLNYLLFAFDCPNTAISQILQKSSLHKELLKRKDATHKLIELFSQTKIDMSPDKSDFDGDCKNLSYTNELFLEYLLCSDLVPNLFSNLYSENLYKAAKEKLYEREQNSEYFSAFSTYPLCQLLERCNQNREQSRTLPPTILSTQQVYTLFRQQLSAYTLTELTNTEIISITNSFLTNYPNAIMRGSSTSKYNCHSYAWHDNSLSNTNWINAIDNNGSLQLSKYWTNDLYVAGSAIESQRAYYSDGDHSAIILPNGKYLSKWGMGPLMEHEYNDCPYVTSNIQYYKERTTPLYNFTPISGDDPIYINQTHTYHYGSNFNLELSVNVDFNLDPSSSPYNLYSFQPGTCYLTCYEPGYYSLYVKGYRNGVCIASSHKGIIVFGR